MDISKVFITCAYSGWNAYKANWKSFLPFTAIAVALTFALHLSTAFVDTASLLSASMLALVLFSIIASYALAVITFATISIANDAHSARKFQWLESYNRSLVPTLKYGLFFIFLGAISILVVLLAAFGGAVAGGASVGALTGELQAALSEGKIDVGSMLLGLLGGAGIAVVIVLIPLVLIYTILGFMLQFTIYEMAAGANGLLKSIQNSISLVRANLLQVFIFGILFFIIFAIISLPAAPFEFVNSALEVKVATEYINKNLGVLNGTLITGVIAIPATLYTYAVYIPLTMLMLVKYWRILKGMDKV